MGEARLYVRFPDGAVRWGLYQDTVDMVLLNGRLFDHPVRDSKHAGEYADDDTDGAVAVDVWCDYGDGFGWAGRATPTRLLPPHDVLDVAGYVAGEAPPWVVKAAEDALGAALGRTPPGGVAKITDRED